MSVLESVAEQGLDVSGVTVEFMGTHGPFAAVDNVSLAVAPGEIVALLGPSGCGKSTLLRTIAGLEQPHAGSLSWEGKDLASVAVHKRGFGLMFQEGQLFAHQNVAGNVAYGLKIQGLSKTQRDQRVAELLVLVGLPGAQTRSIATMSGGERQRVALARALAPRPQLLLLDEPLSALDRELREHLAVELRSILQQTGTGAVFVTHDQDEAFTVADRVAVMRRGKLLQVDAPELLWRKPNSQEVAEFLGYEAFWEGPPARGYAPGHFTVTQVSEKQFGGSSSSSGGTRVPPTTGGAAQNASQASAVGTNLGGQSLEGEIQQVFFRAGKTRARVTVPAVGELTCNVAQDLLGRVAVGQQVTLTPSTHHLSLQPLG
ncbi:ABC transporter ATP-binding protein [Jonesiaceae bacterium BS-20]|uniref:ABC-type quaternary amine transporter n=1 Tax=Jonesiaceae bacterium BS-20 TaxID=3120821 RepID=A0AAU7DT46_9MICO